MRNGKAILFEGYNDDFAFLEWVKGEEGTFDSQLRALLDFYLGPDYPCRDLRVVKYLAKHYWDKHFRKRAGHCVWDEDPAWGYFVTYTENLVVQCVETGDLIEQGVFPTQRRNLWGPITLYGTKVNGRLLDKQDRLAKPPKVKDKQLQEERRLQDQLKYLYITHGIPLDQVAKVLHLSQAVVTELLDRYGYRQFHAAMQDPGARFLSTGQPKLDALLGGRGLKTGELYEFYQEDHWADCRLTELLHHLIWQATRVKRQGGLGGNVLFLGHKENFSWDFLQLFTGSEFPYIARRIFVLPCRTLQQLLAFCQDSLLNLGLQNHIRLACLADLSQYMRVASAPLIEGLKALVSQVGGVGVITNRQELGMTPDTIFGRVRVASLAAETGGATAYGPMLEDAFVAAECSMRAREHPRNENLFRYTLERPSELAPQMVKCEWSSRIRPSTALPDGIERRLLWVSVEGKKRKYEYYSRGHLKEIGGGQLDAK